MFKSRRAIKALSAVTLSGALFLTACSSDSSSASDGSAEQPTASGEPVEIEFWHSASGASADVIRELVGQFNEENSSNITVNEVYQGSYQDAIAALTNAVGTTDLPDVMQVTDTSTGFMMDSGLTVAVEEIVSDDAKDAIGDLVPIIRSYYSYDDTLQAMPFQVSQPVIFANRDLIEEAGLSLEEGPQSIEELTQWAQQIQDNTGTAGITAGLNSYWLEVLTSSAGEHYCTPENGLGGQPADAVNYTTDKQISQWTDMQGIVESGALLNVGQQGADAQNAFGSETTGMLMASSGNYGNVSQMLGDKLHAYPYPIDDPAGGVVPSGNAVWVIGEEKSDDELAASAEFVAFLGNAESQAYSFEQSGYLPNSESAIEMATPNATEVQETILTQLQESEGTTITGGCHSGAMGSIRSDAAQPAVDAIIGGDDVATVLEDAQQTGIDTIERYNERSGQ